MPVELGESNNFRQLNIQEETGDARPISSLGDGFEAKPPLPEAPVVKPPLAVPVRARQLTKFEEQNLTQARVAASSKIAVKSRIAAVKAQKGPSQEVLRSMIPSRGNDVSAIAKELEKSPEKYTYKQYCAVTNLLENHKIELSERSFFGKAFGGGFEDENLLERLNSLDSSSLKLTNPSLNEPLWDILAAGGLSLRRVSVGSNLPKILREINPEKLGSFVTQAIIKIGEALKSSPFTIYDRCLKIEKAITDLANTGEFS